MKQDDFGGIALDDPQSSDEFGGVPVTPSTSTDDFGGVPVTAPAPIQPPAANLPVPAPIPLKNPDIIEPAPETPSIPGVLARSAARNVLPTAGFIAAAPVGRIAGAAAGARTGALLGALVPGLGETGVSEGVGAVIGGLIGMFATGTAAATATKALQTGAADYVAPDSFLGTKSEQADAAAHPIASELGSLAVIGKPNPFNIIRAARTIGSDTGRAALADLLKTGATKDGYQTWAKTYSPEVQKSAVNVLNVAQAGGINAAFNVYDQIKAGNYSAGDLLRSAAEGALFNEPWIHAKNPATQNFDAAVNNQTENPDAISIKSTGEVGVQPAQNVGEKLGQGNQPENAAQPGETGQAPVSNLTPTTIIKGIVAKPDGPDTHIIQVGGQDAAILRHVDGPEFAAAQQSVGATDWEGYFIKQNPEGGNPTIYINKDFVNRNGPIFTHESTHLLDAMGLITPEQMDSIVKKYGADIAPEVTQRYTEWAVKNGKPAPTPEIIKQEIFANIFQNWHENGDAPKETWIHRAMDFITGLFNLSKTAGQNARDILQGRFAKPGEQPAGPDAAATLPNLAFDKNQPLNQDENNVRQAEARAGAGVPPPAEGMEAGRPIAGAPTARPGAEPNPAVQQAANAYNETVGLGPTQPHYVPVDEARARQIAAEYEKLPKSDQSPQTLAAYEQLGKEIQQQAGYIGYYNSDYSVAALFDKVRVPARVSINHSVENFKPATHKDMTPEELLTSAQQVRIKAPSGTTALRVIDSNGNTVIHNLSKFSTGNPLFNKDVARVSPVSVKSGGVYRNQPIPVKGKVQVEPTAMFSVSKQREESPIWRNNIEDALSTWQAKGTPEQLLAHLAKFRGTKDQADWIGLDEFLAGKTSVTKSEVEDFVKANQVDLKEVVKGDEGWSPDMQRWLDEHHIDDASPGWGDIRAQIERELMVSDKLGDRTESNKLSKLAYEADSLQNGAKGDVKFQNYQTPGGLNYRELLLTLPSKAGTSGQKGLGDTAGATSDTANFRSSHFDEPNIVGHIRFNERESTTPENPTPVRTMHLEELQSDWHQKGRKEGYKGNFKPVGWSAKEGAGDIASGPVWRVVDENGRYVANINQERAKTESEAIRLAVDSQRGPDVPKAPNAPFKTSWPMLLFKRALRWAADNGFKRITWTTGEQQADRYDLSHHVDRISYNPQTKALVGRKSGDGGNEKVFEETMEPSKLDDFIGKEAAKNILSKEVDKNGWQTISGEELKVGGAGMKGFYDKILPSEVNKFVKRYGAKVSDAIIENDTGSITTSDIPKENIVNGENRYYITSKFALDDPRSKSSDDRYTLNDSGNNDKVVAEFPRTNDGYGAASKMWSKLMSGDKGTTVHSLDITPELQKAAEGGLPMFSVPKKPSDELKKFPRTAIDILMDESVINPVRPKQVAEFDLMGDDEAAGSTSFSRVFAVADHLSRRSAQLGGGAMHELNDTNAETLANTVANEAEYAINRDPKAIGWYDREMKAAMGQIFNRHPELKKDRGLQSVFKSILAITSNGQNVFANFAQADKLYTDWRTVGKVPDEENWGGKSKGAINDGLKMLNLLIEKLGTANLEKFLAKEFKVGDLKKAGFDISSENTEHMAHGSLIYGPKVGGGFYQNLIGNLNPITMDMWLMRTINRMRGTLTEPSLTALPDQIDRFIKSMKKQPDNEAIIADAKRVKQQILDGTFDVNKEKDAPGVMLTTAKNFYDDYRNSGFVKRTELNRSSKLIAEEFFGINEAPTSASERDFIRNVFVRAQKKLQAKKIDITNADLQAVLWYLEKDIYGKLGATDRRSAPASYSDAAAALNRKQLGLFDEEQGRAGDLRGAESAGPEVNRFGEAGKQLTGAQALKRVSVQEAEPVPQFSVTKKSKFYEGKRFGDVKDEVVPEVPPFHPLNVEQFKRARDSIVNLAHTSGVIQARGMRINLANPDPVTAKRLGIDSNSMVARAIHAISNSDRRTANANKVLLAQNIENTIRQADFVTKIQRDSTDGDNTGQYGTAFIKAYDINGKKVWHLVQVDGQGDFITQFSWPDTETENGRVMRSQIVQVGQRVGGLLEPRVNPQAEAPTPSNFAPPTADQSEIATSGKAGQPDFVSTLKQNPDGFTVDPLTGERPTSGFVVAPSKLTEVEMAPAEVSEQSLSAYLDQFRPLFEQQPGKVYFGGWLRGDGKYVLDVTTVVDNLADALHIARNGKQDGIFDLGKREFIPTAEGIAGLQQNGQWNDARGADLRSIQSEFDSVLQKNRNPEAGRQQQPALAAQFSVPKKRAQVGGIPEVGQERDTESITDNQAHIRERLFDSTKPVSDENTSAAWQVFDEMTGNSRAQIAGRLKDAFGGSRLLLGLYKGEVWKYARKLAIHGDDSLLRAMYDHSEQFETLAGGGASTAGSALRAEAENANDPVNRALQSAYETERENAANSASGIDRETFTNLLKRLRELKLTPDEVEKVVKEGKLPDGKTLEEALDELTPESKEAMALLDKYQRSQTEWLKPDVKKSIIRVIVDAAIGENKLARYDENDFQDRLSNRLQEATVPKEVADQLAFEVWKDKAAREATKTDKAVKADAAFEQNRAQAILDKLQSDQTEVFSQSRRSKVADIVKAFYKNPAASEEVRSQQIAQLEKDLIGETVKPATAKELAREAGQRKLVLEANDRLAQEKVTANEAQQTAERELAKFEDKNSGVEWLKEKGKRDQVLQAIADALKSKSPILDDPTPLVNETKAKLVALGVDEATAGKLAFEIETVRRTQFANSRVRTMENAAKSKSLRSLIESILETPYRAQSDPKWLHETAVRWFESNGLGKDQAEAAARLFQKEFQEALAQASTKVAEAELKKKVSPRTYDDLERLIRAGIFNPDKNWIDQLAAKNGWKKPSREQMLKLQELEHKLSDPELSPEEVRDIQEQQMHVLRHVGKKEGQTLRALGESFTASLLSGIRTLTVQTSPTVMAFRDLPIMALSDPKNAMNFAKAMYNSFKANAVAAFKFAWMKDAYGFHLSELEHGFNEMKRISEETDQVIGSKTSTPVAKALAYTKKLYALQRFVFRNLNSIDQASMAVTREWKLAYYSASAFKEAGLTNTDISQLIDHIEMLRKNEFEKAIDAGLDANTAKVRANSRVADSVWDFVNNKTGRSDLADQVIKATENDVYSTVGRVPHGLNSTDEGFLTRFSGFNHFLQFVSKVRGEGGLQNIGTTALVGMINIPFRTTRYFSDFSPYGLLRYGIYKYRLNRGKENFWKQTYGNALQARARLYSALAGTVAMAAATAWAVKNNTADDKAGDDEFGLYITGKGPNNKVLADAWAKRGFKQYSANFVFGGHIVAIPLTRAGEALMMPFILPAALDDYAWKAKEAEAGGHPIKTPISSATASLIGEAMYMTGQSGILQTFGQLQQATENGGSLGKAAVKVGVSAASSTVLPFRQLLASVSDMLFGSMDSSSISSLIANQFPIVGLPFQNPAVNRFGDPMYDRSWYGLIARTGVPIAFQISRSPENERLYTTLVEKGISPPPLNRSDLESKYGDMTDQQFKQFAAVSGQALKQAITKNLPELQGMSSVDAKNLMFKLAMQSNAQAAMAVGVAPQPASGQTAAAGSAGAAPSKQKKAKLSKAAKSVRSLYKLPKMSLSPVGKKSHKSTTARRGGSLYGVQPRHLYGT